MASRAVGWGANPNLETTISSLKGNGRTVEALKLIKPWTLLDLPQSSETETLLARLRRPDIDYYLATHSTLGGDRNSASQAWIRPAKVHASTILEGCGKNSTGCTWSVNQTFPNVAGFGVRIRALTAVSGQSHDGVGGSSKDLLQLRSKTVVRTTVCKGDISTAPVPHATVRRILRCIRTHTTIVMKTQKSIILKNRSTS